MPEGHVWEIELLVIWVQTSSCSMGAIVCLKVGRSGFVRGLSCGVVFYHEGRDISLAVHGDDFTFCGGEMDLLWIKKL